MNIRQLQVMLTFCLSLIGCSERRGEMKFQSAVVTVYYDDEGNELIDSVYLDNEHDVAKLLSFFSGFGHSSRSNNMSSPWTASLEIRLRREEGEETTLRTNYRVWNMNDGRGDLPVKDGLKPYVRRLFEGRHDR